MCSVGTYVTHENVICPNLCYERTYDVWCPMMSYYIQKCVMSEHMFHANIKCVLPKLMVDIRNTKNFVSEVMLHDVFSPK